MADIFISYAREDMEFIYTLSEPLRPGNCSVWVDLDDLYAGEEFWQRICTAIEEAQAFVFVMSPDSIDSPYYSRRDLAYAVDHNKRIVPIFIARSTKRRYIPAIARSANGSFSALQMTISLSAFRRSWRSSYLDPDWIHAHTRLLVRAKDWEAERTIT